MTDNPALDQNSAQKLSYTCDRRIGVTRFTEKSIQEGPEAIIEKCFKNQISEFVESFSIYDSLDGMFRIADMNVTDPLGWRSVAPLTGNELVAIAYKSNVSGSTSKEKILIFRILKITEENTSYGESANRNKSLIIKLVEFPIFNFLLAQQLYKTYPIDAYNTPKLRLTDIVKDCIKQIKNFDTWYDVEIEDSVKDNINFYVPGWNLMKVANFCNKYALSEKKKYSNYVFNMSSKPDKDKAVLQLKPIFSFVDDSQKFRLYSNTYQEVSKLSSTQNERYNVTDVINSFSFNYYDAKESLDMSGTTNVLFDYIEDNEYVNSDVKDFIKRYKGLNKFVANQHSYGNQWSSFLTAPWNKKEGELLIKNEMKNYYGKILLKAGINCKAMTPIFEGRQVGERAELIFNGGSDDNQDANDKMFSGAWITWEVVDTFLINSCYSSITFINDGFVDIKDPTNTVKNINTITGTNEPEDLES
jgi:hypothetical protein